MGLRALTWSVRKAIPACADSPESGGECSIPEASRNEPAIDDPSTNIETQRHDIDIDVEGTHPRDARPQTDLDQLLNYYFTTVHQTLPIISRPAFTTWCNDGNASDAAFKTCFHSLLCAAIQHAQLSSSKAVFGRGEAYWEHLREALSSTGNVLIASPSIRAVQALAALVACSRHTNEGVSKGHPFLAVAIRFAYSLSLHRLDEEVGLSIVERLERIRLFWCLYILDRSTSLRLHLPPMIDDRDVYVLTPKMYSDDGLGLVRLSLYLLLQ